MTNKELIEKAEEYIKNSDNLSKDEYYGTEAELSSTALYNFFEYMKIKGFKGLEE